MPLPTFTSLETADVFSVPLIVPLLESHLNGIRQHTVLAGFFHLV